MSEPIPVGASNFDEEVLRSEIPVLVDFWAEWCAPCLAVAPAVEELARRYAGRLKVCKVDVEQEMTLADRYNVFSIPCLVFFKDGAEVERHIGLASVQTLSELAERVLGS